MIWTNQTDFEMKYSITIRNKYYSQVIKATKNVALIRKDQKKEPSNISEPDAWQLKVSPDEKGHQRNTLTWIRYLVFLLKAPSRAMGNTADM